MNLIKRFWDHYFPRLGYRSVDLPALSLWDQSLGQSYTFFRREIFVKATNEVIKEELWSYGMGSFGNTIQPKQWDLATFRADGRLIPLPNP